MATDLPPLIQEAWDEIGGLSRTSKMPCYSYSIPAAHCVTGAKLAQLPNTVCSKCYALKGMYMMPSVQRAMDTRYSKVQQALSDPGYRLRFGTSFATVLNYLAKQTYRTIERKGAEPPPVLDKRYFRWHDSGDIQSVEHLELIAWIADLTMPLVRHWLPTREAVVVHRYLEDNEVPPNLTIRLSVHKVDQPIPDQWLNLLHDREPKVKFSGVHKGSEPGEQFVACRAPNQDHKCLDCRQCWHDPSPISYSLH